MFLQTWLYPLWEDSQEIVVKKLPLDLYPPVNGRYPIKVTDPILPEIIGEGDAAHGFWIAAEAVLSKEELQSVTHFECVCRKFIPETQKCHEHNFKACNSSELMHCGADEPIRLVSGLALDRIKLKPNMVGLIGEWTNEYAVGPAVYESFQASDLTGWTVKPLLNHKTESRYDEFFQLFTDTILPPAIIDCSVEQVQSRRKEENGRRRHLGCLTYRSTDLIDQPDFSRSAEPWAGWSGWPAWVVTARVASIFETNKLRGWAFRPVFTTESDLYHQYLQEWQALSEIVASAKKSSFSGGR